MLKPDNPFILRHYSGPEFFCNREFETDSLLKNIENKVNTICFAQRRLGKTALLHHVFNKLSKDSNADCIYIDIYATQRLQEFTNQLANSIFKIYPEKRGVGKRFWELIKLLRPVVTIDELSGTPELSLDINQPKQIERSIPQLLSFLDQQKKKVVIAIDEFQQILTYPENNVEALLRTAIQPLENVSFIFCGSNQAMMFEIFNSVKRPFYASASSLHLQKIEAGDYFKFIEQHFRNNSRVIEPDAINDLLELTKIHTYYTQLLCHRVFSLKHKVINASIVHKELNHILVENEGIYFQYRNLLTNAQWRLLKAIAIEEEVEQPYSHQFLSKHRLGTSAMVKRSMESLINKEMIYRNISVDKPYFEVYDKFLMRWLQRR